MQSHQQSFLEGFGNAVVGQDFHTAHGMLAQWIQDSITSDGLRSRIVERLREMADEWDLDKVHFPRQYEVDEGDMSLDELRSEGSEIPPQVTEENTRYGRHCSLCPAMMRRLNSMPISIAGCCLSKSMATSKWATLNWKNQTDRLSVRIA